jgi:hypothetical protein
MAGSKRASEASSVAAAIAAEISAISREVEAIPSEIAVDSIDLALLLAAPGIPALSGAQVPMLEGTQLTPEIIVALRPLFSELGFVAANVGPVAPDITDVAADITRKGC